MHRNVALGKFGEDLAVQYLERSGCEILDRNWRCRAGELDIVARDGDVLVVCEVKTRSSESFGTPLEAITRRKLATLRSLSLAWLAEHAVNAPLVRLDVIGITTSGVDGPLLHHIRGVT